MNIGSEIVSGSLEQEDGDGDQVVKELSGVERLTPEQISLCQYRHMLLCYLDRLDTYEVSKERITVLK